MAVYVTNTSELTSIANAIRTKGGTSASLEYPTDFVSAILAISTGGSTPSLLSKTNINPTTSSQTITADSGYDGLSSVQINGDTDLVAGNIKSGVTIFGVTGSYAGAGVSLQAKTNISPTTSSLTITADNGYDGLSSVQINAMPTMTLPTSAASSATSGYSSKATISRSTSDQYINIPTGYNSAGAYYKISAVANGSASGPSTVSGTSATISTGTNTITLTKTVSITPTVSAGYVSSGTATNATVTLTASVTTKAAATITPGTSNQTIASGTYLTGAQTISGDADLVASNIISTANIFGVQGSVVINKYYTGSSAPSSSLGSNGDIYIQT